MSDSRDIQLRIHCRGLPGSRFDGRTGVRLGIQRGQEVIDDVSGDVPEVTFTMPFRVTGSPETGSPNFLGPFAQGTPKDRFLYLCWGERKDGHWDGFRRAKVRFTGISWPMLQNAWESGGTIEALITMTDAKGGPLCASVRDDQVNWSLQP